MSAPNMGTPNKPKSKSPIEEEAPVTPPRPRLLCPSCSKELTIHQTLGTNEAFMFASKVDMKKLGLECQNEACLLYIEGLPNVNTKVPVNPNIAKYVDMAKKERDAIVAAENQAKQEADKRKREEEAAEYAKYNPFSGAADEKAMEAAREEEAARIQKQLEEDEKKVTETLTQLLDGMDAARRSRQQ